VHANLLNIAQNRSIPPVLQAVHIFIPPNLFSFAYKVKRFLEIKKAPTQLVGKDELNNISAMAPRPP
jgi:hypothetical protein